MNPPDDQSTARWWTPIWRAARWMICWLTLRRCCGAIARGGWGGAVPPPRAVVGAAAGMRPRIEIEKFIRANLVAVATLNDAAWARRIEARWSGAYGKKISRSTSAPGRRFLRFQEGDRSRQLHGLHV